MKRFLLPAATLAAATAAGPAFAAITYVDAAEGASGNTFATGGSLADTSWVTVGKDDTASTWGRRDDADFGNDGNIFEGRSDASAGQDVPLTTQLTSLSDGLYDVWVFFWDAGGANTWEITAGLDATLTNADDTYSFDGDGNTAGVVAASTLDVSGTLKTTGGTDRTLYAVNLGQATVTGGSNINVFIDQLGVGSSGRDRTWYDGVGYELVPEPSSLALLAMGGLLMAKRRRRG